VLSRKTLDSVLTLSGTAISVGERYYWVISPDFGFWNVILKCRAPTVELSDLLEFRTQTLDWVSAYGAPERYLEF
jgi:hypothetical protein